MAEVFLYLQPIFAGTRAVLIFPGYKFLHLGKNDHTLLATAAGKWVYLPRKTHLKDASRPACLPFGTM